MDEVDQEKTSFITNKDLFCYKVMPFGLKNTGATYQRLVNHMFHPQIGQHVKVYVDDMPGIDPSVITHRLNVYPFSKPVRQKKRVFAPKRDKAINEEV